MSGTPEFLSPQSALAAVEAGRWGVAVSGGADSTALLRLAAKQPSLQLHVLHLDHQTRGEASTGDALFVQQLADNLCLPCTATTRDRLERGLPSDQRQALPANPSARYRALRLSLYRQVMEAEHLQGILLAHHADDQAETIFFRLLRGGGYSALAGMKERSIVADVLIHRPLLQTRRSALRDLLSQLSQPWREDTSNAEDDYARNRLRKVLAEREDLTRALLQASRRCQLLVEWVDHNVPELSETFSVAELADLPEVLARAAAADWLQKQGVPAGDVSPAQVSALLQMCGDAASPPRHTAQFNITIARRRGLISTHRKEVPPL